MWRGLVFLICLLSLTVFGGCDQQMLPPDGSQIPIDGLQQSSSEANERFDSFASYEAALINVSMRYEKIVVINNLLGAKEGLRFRIYPGGVELYRFDENAEQLIQARQTGKVTLINGVDIDVCVNGDTVFYVSEPTQRDELLIDLFYNL